MQKELNDATIRSDHEIAHGKKLAQVDPEVVWGWASAAGRLRAIRRAEIISAGAHLGPGVRALEVGCGTGIFTDMFARTGAQLVAVDISADLLAMARARGRSLDRVQFVEKRFEDCDVEGRFDAVIGSSVLHHLEIDMALASIYRLLKAGGVMSFAEPNMLNPQVMLQKNVPRIKKRLGESPDETAFMRWQIRRLLLKTGFIKVEVRPFDWLHPATPVRLIGAARNLGRILEKIPIIREFAGSLYIRCCRP